MDDPLITVGLQFFNAEATLGPAIESVINQTYSRWELVLHDDGSNDRSVEIAASFRDPRIRLRRDGVRRRRAARINASLQEANGAYYALADADDISYPDRLERQVEYLESNSSIDLLGTGMLVFDNAGRPLGKRQPPVEHESICRRPWSGFAMAQPTFVGRTQWFRTHLYNEKMLRAQDQDLLLRTYRVSRFANLPNILVGYREPKLRASKLLTDRWFLTRSLLREFLLWKRPDLAALAASEQALKAGLDITAVATHLDYHLLRHRAVQVGESEQEKWASIWAHVGGAASRE